jgi:regulatory protein
VRPESDQDAVQDEDRQNQASAARVSAVRLLARREHSTAELNRKLVARGHATDTVEEVVAQLQAKQLVSDERFVASFVHHHAMRGQGPVRIRAELRQQGVAEAAIEAELTTAELDWAALASGVRVRKFGASCPNSLAERAKQSRFLQYRGFTGEHIRAALRAESGPEGLDPDADPGFDPD